MTVEEFLRWPGDGSGRIFELVNGVVRAQDATRPGCRGVTNPGIEPRLAANWNNRVPELGVTCTPTRGDVHATPDAFLLIEVLAPSNVKDTWDNIALYSTVPTVKEIVVVDSTKVGVWLLRRNADGTWPRNAERIEPDSALVLETIAMELPVAAIYRNTHLE